jgi:hypothetical protein
MATVVEILDKSLNRVAVIKNLYPINKDGMVLRYSKELSDYGKCLFRVRSNDPMLDELGDILTPHAYNVRIVRSGTTVWAGAIVDNLQRTKNYIEVQAYEYLYYLDKILVRRSTTNPATNQADDLYRIFTTGTMAAAVTSIVQNAITDFGTPHPLANMQIGTVDNPNYPVGFTNGTATLTGAWNFSSLVSLQFDFHSVYYVLKAFGIYTNSDFEIDESLNFNFETFLGNKHNDIIFQYARNSKGNIVDYNLPRLGRRMVNDLWGIATDSSGKIYHIEQKDTSSINTYGKLEDANAYADVKDSNFLRTRITQDLRFVKTSDDAPINIVLDERAYPLGQYDIGDIVTVKVDDGVINYQKQRRVVGITVNLHNVGRELITVQTNSVRDEDMGGS